MSRIIKKLHVQVEPWRVSGTDYDGNLKLQVKLDLWRDGETTEVWKEEIVDADDFQSLFEIMIERTKSAIRRYLDD